MKALVIFFIATLSLMTVSVQASSHGQKQGMQNSGAKKVQRMAIKHANPLPNFMKVIQHFGDRLDLTNKQKQSFKQWRNDNNRVVQDLVRQTLQAEKTLHNVALKDSSQHELQDLMDKVLSLRLQVAKKKIRCRENMRNTLSQSQWQQVVMLYQESFSGR